MRLDRHHAPAFAAGATEAALSLFVVWPLNVRVGANSPSLWPTMFSVTYTGNELTPVVDGNRVPHHLGNDGRAARPGLDDLLVAAAIHDLDLLEQRHVDEGTLFQ